MNNVLFVQILDTLKDLSDDDSSLNFEKTTSLASLLYLIVHVRVKISTRHKVLEDITTGSLDATRKEFSFAYMLFVL